MKKKNLNSVTAKRVTEPPAAIEIVVAVSTAEPEIPPAEKKLVRKRTRGKKGGKLYFTPDTQKSIIAYQQCLDQKEREMIYVKEIFPALEKLVENLINIYKFSGLHDSYDDLKNDCVTFLFETLRKFDGNRGTNAFSYFNIVAKNWLIIKTKQKANKMRRNVSIDDPDVITSRELRIVEEHSTIPAQDEIIESSDFMSDLKSMLDEIKKSAKTPNEQTCINAIVTVFENVDDVDLLNKSAVLVYIRELSGLKPKQLTSTLHSLKKHYRRIKDERQNDKR